MEGITWTKPLVSLAYFENPALPLQMTRTHMHTQTLGAHLLIHPHKHTHWHQGTKDILIFPCNLKASISLRGKHRRGRSDGSPTCVELKLLIRLDPDVAMRRLLILYITIIFLLRCRQAPSEGSVYHGGGTKRVKPEGVQGGVGGKWSGGGGCWARVNGWRSGVDAEVVWSDGREKCGMPRGGIWSG